MERRLRESIRFLLPLVCGLLVADTAYAQRVPDEFLWCATTGLAAPFVAVPVKLGLHRLLGLEWPASGLWWTSVIEWLLWFPLAVLLLRVGRSSEIPLTLIGLFCVSAWIHKLRLGDLAWRRAMLMALPTPILVLGLPFLAIAVLFLLESMSA